MNRRPSILALPFALALGLALATTVAACGPKKPPKADPVDTQPTVEPEPPKPPPPKCESLDEKCEAVGGKKARIAGSALAVEPVVGWTYAQGEKATVAQTGADTACFGLTGYDVPDVKKADPPRQAALDVLVAELGLTLGKVKVNWKAAGDKLEVGALKLQLWEVKDVTRSGKKGDLLVVNSAPSDGKALLGVAFVPKDDDQSGQKIMKSIETLGVP